MKKFFDNFMRIVKENNTDRYFKGSLVVLASIGFLVVFSLSTALEVRINDESFGYVPSSSAVDCALDMAMSNESQECGYQIVDYKDNITVEKVHTFFAKPLTTDELVATLEENVSWLTSGAVLTIDNVDSFALAGETEGQQVLDTLMAENTPSDTNVIIKSIDFAEDVHVETANVPVEDIQTADAVLATIKAGKEAVKIHEVVEGESLWSISRSNDMTVDELKNLNPQLQGENLQIGQELQLTAVEPLINVVVTKEVTAEEAIPYETTIEETSTLLRGETEVKTAGQNGTKLVTYEVTESSGNTLEKTVLAEKIIQEPVNEIVSQGTSTIMVGSRSGSGALSWPIYGKINSPYGSRSSGFHTGLDIDANTGDSIKAAAGGRVISAGWDGGYGYCVVLDHGNGLKTRYAHLSKITCSIGETVLRGEEVGKAGSTGNSTGPHLHFEVIVNGATQNPMNYLR